MSVEEKLGNMSLDIRPFPKEYKKTSFYYITIRINGEIAFSHGICTYVSK